MEKNELIINKGTMSSIEISELTGRPHANVMRDIKNLLKQGVSEINFDLASYKDKQGKDRPMFHLTKKGCLILASGYNPMLREKIIDRWESLETGKATPVCQAPQTQAELILQLAQQNVERERKMKELDTRQTNLETKVKEIEQRTSTDIKYSTIVGFAARHGIYVGIEKASALGRTASTICKKRNISMGKIPDPRFGTVRTYPDEIIRESFLKYYPNI